ncbi:MAG: hypothetical protein AB1330_05245 [Bacillota bacterium]
MDAIQIKTMYLEFMAKRGWPTRKSGKLVDATFPHCFTISGAVDWFNTKLRTDPFEDVPNFVEIEVAVPEPHLV